MLKEKVYSDARARNHKQIPQYGALFGVGDFVFVPSLEQKVEDTQSKITGLQKELEKLKATEQAALKAQDERARRQAMIEKRTVEAKLKVEQLRQQALEEQRKKKEQEEKERLQSEKKLARQKKAGEERLASLKRTVQERRKSLGGTTLSSLSPEATMAEMQQIDVRIKEIKKSFRNELKNGINQIITRLNGRYLKLADEKQDEFESEAEFQSRIAKEKSDIDREQTGEFTVFQDKLAKEYNQQVPPFIKQLKKLSGNEFTITAENLILKLAAYNTELHLFPVTIKTNEPIKAELHSYIYLSGDEAREFKQHFQNNILRPEIKGNFQTPEVFVITQAYVIDDAIAKQYRLIEQAMRVIDDVTIKEYDLFSSLFIDLGNGTLYDTNTKLIWSKEGNENNIIWDEADSYLKRLNLIAYLGFRDWRMPTRYELRKLAGYAKGAGYGRDGKTIAIFLNKEGFANIQNKAYWTSTLEGSNAWSIYFTDGTENKYSRNYSDKRRVLPVRSSR